MVKTTDTAESQRGGGAMELPMWNAVKSSCSQSFKDYNPLQANYFIMSNHGFFEDSLELRENIPWKIPARWNTAGFRISFVFWAPTEDEDVVCLFAAFFYTYF